MLPCPSNIIAIYLPRKSGGSPLRAALMCPPAPGARGWRPGRAPHLPALVMIISVPISWKRFQSSAPCRSTRGACGVGSGEPGREPLGEPPGEAGGEAARNPSSQPPAETGEEAIAAGAARSWPSRVPSAPAEQPAPARSPGFGNGGDPSAGTAAGRPGWRGPAAPPPHPAPARPRCEAQLVWPRAPAPLRETALPSTHSKLHTHICRCRVCVYMCIYTHIYICTHNYIYSCNT